MGGGASLYKIKGVSIEQVSMRLLEVQSLLNSQTQKLNTSNILVRKLENDKAIQEKKYNRLTCLRYIREHNIVTTLEGNRFFCTFALHTLTQTMRFPEFCEAQIQLYSPIKMVVETANYSQSCWPMELPLLTPNGNGHKSIGRITLKYNIPTLDHDDDPWTNGEERFLAYVCSLIALKIGCDQKEKLIVRATKKKNLLENMLPTAVLDTILETGKPPDPQSYICSILFTDVVGFTDLCSRAHPP